MNKEFWNCLRLMRNAYIQMIEQVSQPAGMTRAEMDVLLFLANNPGRDRAVDIVDIRGLTKSHVSIAVKSLCENGYLDTVADEKDRRVSHLIPTQKAAPVITLGQQAQSDYMDRLFEGLSEEERTLWEKMQVILFANARAMSGQ